MIYFSNAPVRPDSIDATQYEELQRFRASIQTRALFDTYDSLSDFRDKFSRQLAIAMNRVHSIGPSSTGVISAPDFVLSEPVAARREPSLSESAKDLLRTAANQDGTILRMRVFGGDVIQVGERMFNKQGDARDTAKWEAALRELTDQQLVEQTGGRGEVYRVTHAGYQIADRL